MEWKEIECIFTFFEEYRATKQKVFAVDDGNEVCGRGFLHAFVPQSPSFSSFQAFFDGTAWTKEEFESEWAKGVDHFVNWSTARIRERFAGDSDKVTYWRQWLLKMGIIKPIETK